MAASNESGVGDGGLGSDRDHLDATTLPLAAAIYGSETNKGAIAAYARRFGIDKAAGRLKNWFGAIGSSQEGWFVHNVGGHGSDAVYTRSPAT